MFVRGIGASHGRNHLEIRVTDLARPWSQSPVMSCSWHPQRDLLATGDWTTRLWDVNNSIRQVGYDHKEHYEDYISSGRGAFPYVTLDWNNDGESLVAGTYDGHVRIWSRHGHMVSAPRQETVRLLKVKWNARGSYFLTAGFRLSGFTWQGGIARTNKRFKGHTAPVLDVDWKDNSTFASGSMDRTINIYRLRSNVPIQTFRGHTGDVNCVRWIPNGSVLASCSDDGSVKLWDRDVDKVDNDTCRRTLSPPQGHESEVITVSWSPTVPGSLLSGSADGSLCLWDVDRGVLLHTLDPYGLPHFHSHLNSVAFTPDGSYVANVTGDAYVDVWHVYSGSHVHSFPCDAPTTHVCWNRAGNRLAATDISGAIYIFDFRHQHHKWKIS